MKGNLNVSPTKRPGRRTGLPPLAGGWLVSIACAGAVASCHVEENGTLQRGEDAGDVAKVSPTDARIGVSRDDASADDATEVRNQPLLLDPGEVSILRNGNLDFRVSSAEGTELPDLTWEVSDASLTLVGKSNTVAQVTTSKLGTFSIQVSGPAPWIPAVATIRVLPNAMDACGVDGATIDRETVLAQLVQRGFRIRTHGGPVLTKPRLVTVSFEGFAHAREMEAWGDWVVGSDWLRVVGRDYGVTEGAHVGRVVLSENDLARLRQTDLSVLLTETIRAGAIPAPESSELGTVYMVYVPDASLIFQYCGGGSACHLPFFWARDDGGWVASAIALVPAAGRPALASDAGPDSIDAAVADAGIPGLCDAVDPQSRWLRGMQLLAAHEFIEAVTNPLVGHSEAFVAWAGDETDPCLRALVAGYLGDREVSDFCGGCIDERGFVAERVWSNGTGAGDDAGRPGCIP